METKQLIKLFRNLKANRSNFENYWQELADYCLPMKATITSQRMSGQKLPTTIYDSTAISAVNIFAAGLHSYLTNPSSKWFALSLLEKELLAIQEVKEWLKECEDMIFNVFNSTNFNQQIHETYRDFITFGTACLYEEEDFEKDIRFSTRPISEIFIMENDRGIIDLLIRYFSYDARQATLKWGDSVSDKIKEKMNSGKWDERFEFLHIIKPRYDRVAGKEDSKNKPFSSTYLELSEEKELSVGGYDDFPFFVPRFTKVSNEVYGYCQTMIALPDIKTLNAMSKTILKAAQKQVDPPLVVPDDALLLPFKATAGAVNIKTSGTNDKIEVIEQRGQLGIGLEMEEQRRRAIKSALFVDLFLLLAQSPDMTATEVRERVFEKMLILGPTLGRLMNELLDPIIHRTFAILARLGKLPPVPQILRGRNYKIEYISPLAKAQKAAESQSINEFLGFVTELAKVNQETLDNVNFDKAVQELAEIKNIPANILRSDDEVQKLRQGRNEALAQQQQLQMAQVGAGAAKDITQAEKNLRGKEGK